MILITSSKVNHVIIKDGIIERFNSVNFVAKSDNHRKEHTPFWSGLSSGRYIRYIQTKVYGFPRKMQAGFNRVILPPTLFKGV